MKSSSSSAANSSSSSDIKKRKRESSLPEKQPKQPKTPSTPPSSTLNNNPFISPQISSFISTELLSKFKILKQFEPTTKTPFFIIYSNARELMKNLPFLIESIYNLEISSPFKLSNSKIPIGFDAEYKKDWKISTIQISLQSISFVFQIDNLKELPKELIDFLQFKTIKLGVGVCNDIKHLFTQKVLDSNNIIVKDLVDLSIVSSQYHLFGSSMVSLKQLATELLKMENLTSEKKQSNDAFVKYAAFDAYIGYAAIYKLYEIMSDTDFESWIEKQCKDSNDPAFQVISTNTNTNNTTTNSTTNTVDGNATNSSVVDSNNNSKVLVDSDSSSSVANLLKGKSFTSLKELAKLDPNATNEQREEFLNMRSTYMGMIYGDKTGSGGGGGGGNQQISYAREKNQARLRKMAHKNSTQRNITSLVDQMKQKQSSKKEVVTNNSGGKSDGESKKKAAVVGKPNVEKKKAVVQQQQKSQEEKKTKKYSTSNVSFQLV